MRNQVLSVEQMLNLKRLDISSAGMCWCYPIGYKSGLNIGTLSKGCFNCKFAKEAFDSQFVRCIYHRFYPFKQFVCNNHE